MTTADGDCLVQLAARPWADYGDEDAAQSSDADAWERSFETMASDPLGLLEKIEAECDRLGLDINEPGLGLVFDDDGSFVGVEAAS